MLFSPRLSAGEVENAPPLAQVFEEMLRLITEDGREEPRELQDTLIENS